MIDQVLEAREYMDGKNIAHENMFRICYMMAKILLADGMGQLEIRNWLFEWGKKHGVYFKFNVNDAIIKASNDNVVLVGGTEVWVSSGDVEEISKRFDSRIAKCTALAMLCLSKVSPHKNKEFVIPTRWLTAWLGEKSRATYMRVINELIMFDYLAVVDRKNRVSRWNKKNYYDGTIYRLIPPVHSGKDYKLDGNNIWKLYDNIFSGK